MYLCRTTRVGACAAAAAETRVGGPARHRKQSRGRNPVTCGIPFPGYGYNPGSGASGSAQVELPGLPGNDETAGRPPHAMPLVEGRAARRRRSIAQPLHRVLRCTLQRVPCLPRGTRGVRPRSHSRFPQRAAAKTLVAERLAIPPPAATGSPLD
eukprot:scaffold577_cov405-Prasinococcus_capsulatus_cf.AAC.17